MKNLKIESQLKIGFALLLFIVVVLGVVSFQHANKLYEQTDIMYQHPLKVRSAIGQIENDILKMRIGQRDLMLAKTEKEKQDAILLMNISATHAISQFDILSKQYLGPHSDIDEAYNAFISWDKIREENAKLALSGNIEQVKKNLLPTGEVGIYREKMMTQIKEVDDYAVNKAETLYVNSKQLKDSLNNQLIFLVLTIFLLSSFIFYFQELINHWLK